MYVHITMGMQDIVDGLRNLFLTATVCKKDLHCSSYQSHLPSAQLAVEELCSVDFGVWEEQLLLPAENTYL